MKYRIKVFPFEGELLYMPQIKGRLWGYNNMFYNDEFFGWKKSRWYNTVITTECIKTYMLSEASCLEYIKLYDSKLKQEEVENNQIKKFEKENKIRYIEGNLDE